METQTIQYKHRKNRGGIVRYDAITSQGKVPFVREILVNRYWFTQVLKCQPPSRMTVTFEEKIRPGATVPSGTEEES